MKNMNWQQFLTEFVLRAMARPDVENYNFPARYAADLAREAWDAIQAAEFPKNMANSPKDTANSPDLKPSISTELKQLAELAAAQGFNWIAQDKCRIWYGYKVEPEFREHLQEWWGRGNGHWAALNLPDNTDYSKQIFNVKTILENE